jgi:hypothetical protein
MNWKTTLVLLLLAGGCAFLFWKGPEMFPPRLVARSESETEKALRGVDPRSIVGVEVTVAGKPPVRLKAAKPGQPLAVGDNWPVRTGYRDELVNLLSRV